MVDWSIIQGGTTFAILAAIYAFTLWQDYTENHVRVLVLFALVAAILSLIFVNRSYAASVIRALGRKNKALLYVLSSLVIISVSILFVPVNTTLLKFSALDRLDFLIALAGSTSVLLFL